MSTDRPDSPETTVHGREADEQVLVACETDAVSAVVQADAGDPEAVREDLVELAATVAAADAQPAEGEERTDGGLGQRPALARRGLERRCAYCGREMPPLGETRACTDSFGACRVQRPRADGGGV